MPISTLLIQFAPQQAKAVATELSSITEVEITEQGAEHLIAITDTADSKTDYQVIQKIEKCSSIQNVTIVMSLSDEFLQVNAK